MIVGVLPALVTVAIPVLNGARVIGEQLAALAAQDYPARWELVVIDNGSTDATRDVVESFRDRFAALRIVTEPRPGIGPARNRALHEAAGGILLICDADDVVQPGWLTAMVRACASYSMVGGRCVAALISDPMAVAWRSELPADRLPVALDSHPFVPGGNCAVQVAAARAIGGWDETFAGGADDVDFSWRLVQAGHTLGFAPDAVLAYRYRAGLRALIRQFYRYGVTEVPLHRRHQDWGLPRYRLRDLAARWIALVRAAPRQLRRQPERGVWLREASYRAGRLAGSIRYRHLLP
jgi:glycosyltransferase involved in cell wall biosynthesis